MGLLQSLRGGRDIQRVETPADLAPPPAEPAPTPSNDGAEHFAATQAIGARQERFSADLSSIAQVVAQVEQLRPMMAKLHEPLMAEFEAHRQDHSELLSAKTQNTALAAVVKTLRETEQSLSRKLSETTKASDDARVELEALRKSLSHALAEGARSREDLSAAREVQEDLKLALTASTATIGQLQEDVTSLRTRVDQGAERRRELDALSARAQQEADLAEAENTSLRHRIEDLAEQLSRVTRAEAQAQADIAAERERAANQLAEAERTQRDAIGHAQAFESQLAASRAEAVSLATRVEATVARNTKLERLCVELSTKANDAISYRQAMEGAAGDAKTTFARALERIEQLERAAAEQKSAHASLDRARLTALERADQLAGTLQAQEAALARADERARVLEESLHTLANDEEQLRRFHEDETSRLSGDIRRLEAEVQLAQSALRAAREHRAFA